MSLLDEDIYPHGTNTDPCLMRIYVVIQPSCTSHAWYMLACLHEMRIKTCNAFTTDHGATWNQLPRLTSNHFPSCTCKSIHPHAHSGLPGGISAFFDITAVIVYAAWFFGLVLLHLVLPGRTAEGTVLPNGKKLKYKLNGERGKGLRDGIWGSTLRGRSGICKTLPLWILRTLPLL